MTDQKKIAAIFNDFMALYRGTAQIGIQEICKKYENHRMLIGLLANLDAATSIPVTGEFPVESVYVKGKWKYPAGAFHGAAGGPC